MTVTFSEQSEMYIVDSLLEVADPDDVWFTREALHSFKSDVVDHISWVRLQRGHILPVDKIIGIERFISREVTVEYQRRKNTLMREVLNPTAQDPLSDKHDHADRLARISAANSMWARARARMSAMLLEEELVCEDLLQLISNSRR
ncbi:hypothetical protein ACHAWU_004220 [Discostella pseudostelligera]|uniref:Uncharacterized protein n=1 Tax=Discostella pseudostelligera TaxID=259834 RepID=A0ABD3M289_9STRA